jgi:hypothetical protein
MLKAESVHLKLVKGFAESKVKLTVEYDLEFAIKETSNLPLKYVTIKATWCHWIHFYFEFLKDPTCKKLKITEEVMYDE